MQKNNEQGNLIITEGIKERKLYVEMENENRKMEKVEVAVSEEVYLAYKRPAWKEHKRKERERQCRHKKSGKCDGDCLHCRYKEPRKALSSEQMIEDGIPLPAAQFSIEEYIQQKELREALYAAIETLDERDKRIIILFSQGRTEREIAAEMGCPQKTVNNHKHKAFARLKELLKDFV